jgi:UDP-N-acetylglucosamine:LPS N-acetylglucosamine transferase
MEEQLVPRAGIPIRSVHAGGVHGVGWGSAPGNAVRLLMGTAEAWKEIGAFGAQVLLVTGGYLTVPAAAAARLRGVPVVLYVPDIEPAMAARFAARLASRIAVTAERCAAYYRRGASVSVTGYPLREEVVNASRAAGRKAFGIPADEPVLLAFGGSRGARSINRALSAALPKLLEEMQVIHITGTLDWPEVEKVRHNLPKWHKARYHAYPYLHEEMGGALASADVVVSRAGASVLGEYPHFALPSILVPYPHAWRYQRVNAEYLESQGAAVVLPDDTLSESMAAEVLALMRDKPRRKNMRRVLEKINRKNSALKLAGEVIAAVKEGPR